MLAILGPMVTQLLDSAESVLDSPPGPGQGLLAPSVSANSEKAGGVMVTGVLDVSL